MANTTFQGPVTSKAGFITTGPANVVDADSSVSLTVATHSGKIVHNDAAGAVTYTLPATNANSDSAVAGPGADLNNLSNVGAKFEIFALFHFPLDNNFNFFLIFLKIYAFD